MMRGIIARAQQYGRRRPVRRRVARVAATLALDVARAIDAAYWNRSTIEQPDLLA